MNTIIWLFGCPFQHLVLHAQCRTPCIERAFDSDVSCIVKMRTMCSASVAFVFVIQPYINYSTAGFLLDSSSVCSLSLAIQSVNQSEAVSLTCRPITGCFSDKVLLKIPFNIILHLICPELQKRAAEGPDFSLRSCSRSKTMDKGESIFN